MTFGDLTTRPFENMMKPHVYIEHSSAAYRALFENLGFEVVYAVEAASLICFTGGSDVSPSLYGDKAHETTYNDEYRDAKEERLFNYCVENKIPMVGICRGGQFLNVMSGGRMYQDVTGHGVSHFIIDTRTLKEVYVSSTHHQMMMPSEKASIIATSVGIISAVEWYEKDRLMMGKVDDGIEVVYYPHTNCLCFQPHPEFTGKVYKEMHEYFRGLLKECFDL